jgi:hypothetical protein
MTELNDFFNEGHGWVCRPCYKELESEAGSGHAMPRFFREGEAESKNPDLRSRALARWTDKTRRFLACPRCGIVEAVDIS